MVGRVVSEFFLAVGLGIGGSEEAEEAQRKSMSCERTFGAMEKEEELVAKLSEQRGRGMGWEGWEELAIEDAGGWGRGVGSVSGGGHGAEENESAHAHAQAEDARV